MTMIQYKWRIKEMKEGTDAYERKYKWKKREKYHCQYVINIPFIYFIYLIFIYVYVNKNTLYLYIYIIIFYVKFYI